MNWQPIETAPKDGTWLLVGRNVFSNSPQYPEINACRWWSYTDINTTGWTNYRAELFCDGKLQPTHWMELPT